MHRSGTSALAGLLDRAGVYFGPESQQMPAHECNVKGFHERLDVVSLNEEILSWGESAWDLPHKFDPSRYTSEARVEISRKIEALVASMADREPWYLKDPRLCLTLPFWRPLLSRPLALLTIRNPLEIAKSLSQRGDCTLQTGLAMWEAYTLHLLGNLRGLPFMTVRYDSILRDPDGTLASIQSRLQAEGMSPLPHPVADPEWIEQTLQHQKADEAAFTSLATPSQIKLFKDILDTQHPLMDNLPKLPQASVDILDEYERLMVFPRRQTERQALQLHLTELERDEARRRSYFLSGQIDATAVHSAQALATAEAFLSSWRWKATNRALKVAGRDQPQFADERLLNPLHAVNQLLAEGQAHGKFPEPPAPLPRVCAIIPIHDEARFVGPAIDHLIALGVDVHAILDRSPPDVREAVQQRLGKGVVAIEEAPPSNHFDLHAILQRIEQRSNNPEYDWFLRCDIDEFRYPERPGESFPDFVARVEACGFNAVNFTELVFIPTREQPDHDHSAFRETMRHFYHFAPQPYFRLQLWKRQPEPIDLTSNAGHRVDFPNRFIYPVSPPMLHYLYLSEAHFFEKYRVRTYPDEDNERGWHGWRNQIDAVHIELPSQNELHPFDPGNPWDIRTDSPRQTPYIELPKT
ncbi:MAG TPA: hypothetical protein PKE55_02640 [Kiritimatiellia bacterium]|nr:hypothetical protein [Kiritimatiellia bacterium]